MGEMNSSTQVTIKMADQQGELEVVNSDFRMVAGGFSVLKADLAPGLYKARAIVGGTRNESLFVVQAQAQPFCVTLDPLRFPSPVPLRDTTGDHHFQQQALVETRSPMDSGYYWLGDGGQILLNVRDAGDARFRQKVASPEQQNNYMRSFDGFRLSKAHQEEISLDFDQLALRDPDRGLMLLHVDLQPGYYILSYESADKETLAVPIPVVEGWQSQVFIDLEMPQSLDRPGHPDLSDMAIMMVPLGTAFDADDRELRLTEIARYSLLYGRFTTVPEQLREPIRNHSAKPILSLLVAHMSLLEKNPDRHFLKIAMDHIASMIGADFPDLLALHCALAKLDGIQPSLPKQGLPFPPLLRASWNMIADYPALMVPGSLVREVAKRLAPDGFWLTWLPSAAAIPTPSHNDIAVYGARSGASFHEKNPYDHFMHQMNMVTHALEPWQFAASRLNNLVTLSGAKKSAYSNVVRHALNPRSKPTLISPTRVTTRTFSKAFPPRFDDIFTRNKKPIYQTSWSSTSKNVRGRIRDSKHSMEKVAAKEVLHHMDETSAALIAIKNLAFHTSWGKTLKTIKENQAGLELLETLSNLQKSLLPVLQLIHSQKSDGDDFTRDELKQLQKELGVPMSVFRECLEDLEGKAIELELLS